MSDSESSDDLDTLGLSLRSKLHTITTLLALMQPKSVPEKRSFSIFNDFQRQRLRILQAFRVVIVREDEVVTTAAYTSFKPPPQLNTFALNKSVQPYILLVMQELQEEYNFGSDLRVPPDPRKTFIHNPCEDTYFKSRQAANHDVLSNDGQSYWSDVLNDPWQFLEMR